MGPQSVVTPSPLRFSRSRWLVAVLAVSTALAACKKEEPSGPTSPTPSQGGSSSSSGQSSSQGSQPQASQEPLKPESYAPVIKELGPINAAAPAFPLATSAIAPLRAKAEAQGKGDFSPLWSGQNASGCKEIPAADLTRELAAKL